MNARWTLGLLILVLLLIAERPALAQRLHYLGIAGDADEAVFQSEVVHAGRALAAVWPVASSHVVGGSLKGGATYEAVRRGIARMAWTGSGMCFSC